jgi:hypothetical protein
MEEKQDKIVVESANVTRFVKLDDKFKQSNEVFFTAFEPKVGNRHLVQMGEKDNPIFPSFTIKSIDRPEYSTNYDRPGWRPVMVSLYDPIVPSMAQAAYKLILEPSLPFNTYLKLLGPVGDVVESWIYQDCCFTNFWFGSVGWSDSGKEDLTIKLMMKYKNAILEF